VSPSEKHEYLTGWACQTGAIKVALRVQKSLH